MSYIQFQQKCNACGESWNAALGIVGTTQIAAPPTECPKCKSSDIYKFSQISGNTNYAMLTNALEDALGRAETAERKLQQLKESIEAQ